jgi:hypothetical protein
VILKILKSGAAKGLGTTFKECKDLPLGMCDACLRGKTNQVPVSESVEAQVSPASVFEVMHMDIKDLTCKSLQGNKYTTFVVDEGSGKHYVYDFEAKVDKEEVVEQFVKEEVLPSKHDMVKVLTADCDPNFLNARFQELWQLMGIRMQLSPPHKHQCNGRAERAIQADIKLMRTVIARYNSPKDVWELAFDYVIFTRNRRGDSLRNNRKSPEERVSGEIPNLSIARPFDAPCRAFIYKEEQKGVHTVFRTHVRMGRMVGYSKIVPSSYLVLNHNQTIDTRSTAKLTLV